MKILCRSCVIMLLCALVTAGCSSKPKPKVDEPPAEENFYPLYFD